MICPQCNTSYQAGFSRCGNCGIPLVAEKEKTVGIKDVLRKIKGMPIDQSIGPVVKALAASPVLVAGQASSQNDMRFHTAPDKQGKLWIYIYSDQEELSKAYPNGGSYFKMNFVDALGAVGPDDRFGGILINSKSDAMYAIPRQFFVSAYRMIVPKSN